MFRTPKPQKLEDLDVEISRGSAISDSSLRYERSVESYRLVSGDSGVRDEGDSSPDRKRRDSVPIVGTKKIEQIPLRTFVVALAIAILSHAIAGMPSGAFRFIYTRTGAAPMFVGMITTLPCLPFVFAWVWYKHGYRALLKMPYTWHLTLIFVIWMPCAAYAADFTLSVYVQLGSLSVPFLTVLIENLAFKKAVPSCTFTAIFFSTIGSVFAIFGDTIRGSSSELSIGWNDAIGLGLAFLSFVCIALNVVTIRRIGDHPSIVTPDMVTVFWVNFGCVVGSLPTFFVDVDDWLTVWEHIAIADYAMLAMICVVYQVGTVWLDKLSIPHIGSPLYAAMLPFRMVFAIIGGYLLLGETFAPLNLAGTGVAVFVTFLYVGRQYIDRRNRFQAAEEDDVEASSSPMGSGDDDTANDEGPQERLIKSDDVSMNVLEMKDAEGADDETEDGDIKQEPKIAHRP